MSAKGDPASRIAQLARHVEQAALVAKPADALAAAAVSSLTATPERARSFWRGLLAHAVLVPSWTVSPVLLLTGLIKAGSAHGPRGIFATLGLGVGLMSTHSGKKRALMCAAIAAIAYRVKAQSQRMPSVLAAGVVSFLCWMTTVGGEFAQWPGLCSFLETYARDYYKQAEMRGALEDVRQTKSFFAFHPHGCLSAGWTINGTFNSAFTRLAGRVNWLVDPGLRHKNPFFRMLCDAYRREDRAIEGADRRNFATLMGKGESVALIPGGFQDAVVHEYGKDRVVVKRRKGFVKYCLQYGYRLHPVYTFGESETYTTFTGLKSIRMALSEYNIPMVAFFGWWLCPVLPRMGSRIVTYVGKGIDVPHVPEPTAEDVDKWHQIYLKALTELFYEKRAEAGFPNGELELL